MAGLLVSVIQGAHAARYDVTAYGANGGDALDDTTAIQNAISDASSNGGQVYIPAGTYYVYTTLFNHTTNRKSFSIVGDGPNATKVILTGSGVNLLQCDFLSDAANLTISDLTFSNNITSGYIGAALSVSYPNLSSPVTNPGLLATRFHINTESGSLGWGAGVMLQYAWNSKFADCHFSNVEGQGVGIWMYHQCINVTMANCSFSYWSTGFGASDYIEGLFVSSAIMVDVNVGFSFSGGATAFELTNSHIDARGSACKAIYSNSRIWLSSIKGNMFLNGFSTAGGSDGNAYAIYGYFGQSVIEGNSVTCYNRTNGMVLLGNSTTTNVSNNIVDAVNGSLNGIWVQTGATNIKLIGNGFSGTTNKILDQGSGTIISLNN